MPRIEQDPNIEVIPNFDSEVFKAVFQPLVTEDKTLEDIIADTKKAWEEEHQRKVEQWEQQEELDRMERAEREKKKPKLKAFVPHKVVATITAPRAPQYAINKLRNLDIPEMYYFTQEGCEEARLQDRTTSSSAMTLTQGEDGLMLTLAVAHKPSAKVIPDHLLSYRQMMIAKTGLLAAMSNELVWPRAVITALASLFLEMDNHSLRREVHGEEALVIYMVEVRREWHEQLKSADENVQPFNISVVNEERIQRIYRDILNTKQAAVIARSVTRFP
ncbi:hypothetical protein FA13DRAFT_1766210 [Coprinellus micaceus]|uniref:Uncharacterized protein n=1 Tax=Coprinellus micaceus TaxID=71717 RepID=A0A4Y7SPB1_COPMI|nr:hypothetical protein FA13DRAFT_1766210 [Coprinellus micaceus]